MVSEEESWGAPAISPDGDMIAVNGYLSDDYSERQLYLIDVESKAISRVAEGGFPAWSPDGRLLAYAHQTTTPGDPQCYHQIWKHVLSSGSGTKILETSCDGDLFRNLVWSPDQTLLAYINDLEGSATGKPKKGIYVLDLDSGATSLVYSTAGLANSITFSPDGGKIMYHAWSATGQDQLLVVDLNGRRCHRVAVPLHQFYEVKLSADGRRIAFDRYDSILVGETDDVLGQDFWNVGEPCNGER
jgi:Tol biopolymer transport system component